MENVEEERDEFHGVGRLVRTEAAHRLLEASGPALLVVGEGLSVEHDLRYGQPAHHTGHQRHSGGDHVEPPGEHRHLIAGPVNLDTGAVQLPLDRRRSDRGQSVGDRGGCRGQHRAHRAKGPDVHPEEGLLPLRERRVGDRPQVTAQRGGSADQSRPDTGRSRHRVHHESFQSALPQLADEEPAQEGLLIARGPPEQFFEQLSPPGLGSGGRECRECAR